MIDLTSILTKYPKCENDVVLLRNCLKDLYPLEKRAKIAVITSIVELGIAKELKQNRSLTSIQRIKYVELLEDEYGFATNIIDEGLDVWCRVYGLKENISSSPSEKLTVTTKQLVYNNANRTTYRIGDIIQFGKYIFCEDGTFRPIEWIVLDVKSGKALLLSRYALDCKPYNTKSASVTWGTSTLREWLNHDFVNKAFDLNEKAFLLKTKIKTEVNPAYKTRAGRETEDKVFLLSIEETKQYFASDSDCMCEPSPYVESHWDCFKYRCTSQNQKVTCWWWLRSPGYTSYFASDIYGDGEVDCFGQDVDSTNTAVRPALWISLKD